MNHTVCEINGTRYIRCDPAEPLRNERHALDLISACYDSDVNRVLIHAASLPDDFFRLRTGLAGALLQKLSNYRVKAAVILSESCRIQGKFEDFLLETNRGDGLRMFLSEDEAVLWLTAQ